MLKRSELACESGFHDVHTHTHTLSTHSHTHTHTHTHTTHTQSMLTHNTHTQMCAVLFLGCFFFFFNRLTSLKCQLQNNSVKNITHTKNYWVVFFVCATSLDIYMFHALAIALTLTFHLSISCWPHSYPLIQFETDKTGDQVSCVLYKIKWVTTCT